jgi:hemerythrin
MVDKLEWEARYSIGHPVIDAQHRALLELYSRAAACLADDSEAGQEEFYTLLNDLAEHSRIHFRTEEEIMASLGCPSVLQHSEEHLDFIQRLSDFILAAAQGTLDKTGVHAFLDDWWQHHVLEADMQYRPFLSAQRPEKEGLARVGPSTCRPS